MFTASLQVRNRTQEEISANLSAHEAAERERQFFDGEGLSGVSAHVSEALKVLPPEQKGKQALIDLLLKVQGSRLKDSLVPVKKKVCRAWQVAMSKLDPKAGPVCHWLHFCCVAFVSCAIWSMLVLFTSTICRSQRCTVQLPRLQPDEACCVLDLQIFADLSCCMPPFFADDHMQTSCMLPSMHVCYAGE